MSAFIVPAGHIDYLVTAVIAANIGRPASVYFARERVELGTADAVGRARWRENVASVAHRYPRDTPDTLPGPMGGVDPDAYQY